MQTTPPLRSIRRKRVLVVDAHPVVRIGLTRLLQDEPDVEVVGAAGTPEDAVRAATATGPDLVVVGLVFRDGGGLDLVKRLRSACERGAILVLSGHPASLYAERALRAGARGFVSKFAETADILRAVRKVLGGESRVIEPAGELVPQGNLRPLTDREVQVLEHIGRGLRSREIAETMGLSEKTIEGYRAQLREKLDLPDAASLLQHAIRWVRLV